MTGKDANIYYVRRKTFVGIVFSETIDAKQRVSQSACSLFLWRKSFRHRRLMAMETGRLEKFPLTRPVMEIIGRRRRGKPFFFPMSYIID